MPRTIVLGSGPDAVSLKIPILKYIKCAECSSSRHWELMDVEQNEKGQYKFIFECRNVYYNKGEEYECQGRIEY